MRAARTLTMNVDVVSVYELHIPFPKITVNKNLGNVRNSSVILSWQFPQLNDGFPIQCLSVSCILFQQRIQGSSELSIPNKSY